MELLHEYDSESSSSGASPPPPLPPPPPPPPPVAILGLEELERRRQAVATALSHQSSPLAAHRRLTPAERAFEFRAYASKRRHRDANDVHALSPQPPTPPQQPPLLSQDDAIESSTDFPSKGLPTRVARRFVGHSGAVNCVQWSPSLRTELFLSASMDASVRIWDVRSGTCRRTLQMHAKGVKNARWSLDGTRVLSGSYDGCAVYADAETGAALHSYVYNQSEPTAVTSVCVHPSDANLFLAGMDTGRIVSHDVRQAAPCRTLRKGFGDVHDLLFLSASGERFVSSAGLKYRDASHQTLLVWDFASGALLSDRLDRDLQPFCCLRLHPQAPPRFVAQSSANYALVFSAIAPFKRVNKGRSRFAGGHVVQGVSVQCSFSADGAVLATGDAGGRVFYYDATSKRVLRRLEPFRRRGGSAAACVCAEFQPRSGSSALVAGAFDGQLVLYDRAKDPL
ncbi:hypothetical protein PybrP1_012597 [[Pythium] brassicae (nom. inval.)]|nr:hypothetical protein PybrP1_012597 [[Pythium] brassicae (nom. inval.)]